MESSSCDSPSLPDSPVRSDSGTGFLTHIKNKFEYLSDGLILKLETDRMVVSFVHEYFARWFLGCEKEFFENEIRRQLGKPNIKFIYVHGKNFSAPIRQLTENWTPREVALSKSSYFDDFFASGKNALALSAAKIAAGVLKSRNEPSFLYFNPLLIIGGPEGTGKSRLLDAIRLTRAGEKKGINLYHGNAKYFCSSHAGLPEENFWNQCDILLLDDLEEIESDNEAQNRLARLIDSKRARHVSMENAQDDNAPFSLVCAFSGTLAELNQFGEKLRSRLETGLFVELTPPDIETRLKFIENINKKNALGLSRSLILEIARGTRSIPQIMGILRNLDFSVKNSGLPATLHELEEKLRGNNNQKNSPTAAIMQKVSKRFNLKLEDMLAPCRKPDRVLARQVAMYICRRKLGLSYPDIGRLFGGMDHSTVIHAIKKVRYLADNDKDMYKLVTELEKEGS